MEEVVGSIPTRSTNFQYNNYLVDDRYLPCRYRVFDVSILPKKDAEVVFMGRLARGLYVWVRHNPRLPSN